MSLADSVGGVVAEIFRDRRRRIFFFLGNRSSRSIRLPQLRAFFLTFPAHLEITRN